MTKQIYTPFNFNGNVIEGLRPENLSAAPSPGNAGRIIFNTTLGVLQYDTGAAFQAIAGAVAWGDITGKPTITAFAETLLDDASASAMRTTLGLGSIATLNSIADTNITASTITNAKLANVATATIKGRVSASTGAVEDLTAAQVKTLLAIAAGDVSGLGALATASSVSLTTQATGTLQAAQAPAHTGDVTSSAGSLALTIASGVVTNAKLATVPTATFKARTSAGTGAPEDLTVAQAKTLLAITSSDVSGLGALATASSVNLTTQASGTLQAAQFPALTGDVTTTAGALGTTIGTGVVSNAKLATMATARIKGRTTAGTGAPEDLTAAQVKTMLAIAIADVSGLQTALDGKAATTHTHLAADITDFAAQVQTQVATYWDTIAGTDANVDTIREVLDLVIAHSSDVANIIKRFNATIGNGSSTSIAVTHNLNSLDVQVEVYDIATGESVEVGVIRTSVNVVTIEATPAPATNSLRVVIKQ
ncbi:hypothetical protein RCZAHN_38 [Rhodobacter phage RcZahn]|nr:hypothetical protein RCZAHN_38 [Rhodobacter phage RcZahn]